MADPQKPVVQTAIPVPQIIAWLNQAMDLLDRIKAEKVPLFVVAFAGVAAIKELVQVNKMEVGWWVKLVEHGPEYILRCTIKPPTSENKA